MVERGGREATIPGRFLRHAARRAQEPWLFLQQGWDWRWRALGEVAAWLPSALEAIADLEGGTRVGYSGRLSPSQVAADLALQGAGLVAVPISAELSAADRRETARARGCAVWLELEQVDAGEVAGGATGEVSAPAAENASGAASEADSDPAGATVLSGSETRRRLPPLPVAPPKITSPVPEAVPLLPAVGSGGALVVRGGRPTMLDAASLADAAERVAEALGPPPAAQEITVLSGDLEEPLHRHQLAWATWTGAAVVLEPDRAAFVATAAWARPTVLAGSAEDLARARARAEACRPGPRSPFGRLRAWLVPAGEEVPEPLTAFWLSCGVRLLPVPIAA